MHSVVGLEYHVSLQWASGRTTQRIFPNIFYLFDSKIPVSSDCIVEVSESVKKSLEFWCRYTQRYADTYFKRIEKIKRLIKSDL